MNKIEAMRAELKQRLRAAGHDARIHPDTGAVVLPMAGKWWRVVGGDVARPSVLLEPTPSKEPQP